MEDNGNKVEFGVYTTNCQWLIDWNLNFVSTAMITKRTKTYFHCGPFLLSGRSKFFPPTLAGKQYGKMEPKYSEGGHCQSVLRPQRIFNAPPRHFKINSVEMVTPFNVANHPRCLWTEKLIPEKVSTFWLWPLAVRVNLPLCAKCNVLKCSTTDAQSICNKTNKTVEYVNDHDVDIGVFSETQMSDNELNNTKVDSNI